MTDYLQQAIDRGLIDPPDKPSLDHQATELRVQRLTREVRERASMSAIDRLFHRPTWVA